MSEYYEVQVRSLSQLVVLLDSALIIYIYSKERSLCTASWQERGEAVGAIHLCRVLVEL